MHSTRPTLPLDPPVILATAPPCHWRLPVIQYIGRTPATAASRRPFIRPSPGIGRRHHPFNAYALGSGHPGNMCTPCVPQPESGAAVPTAHPRGPVIPTTLAKFSALHPSIPVSRRKSPRRHPRIPASQLVAITQKPAHSPRLGYARIPASPYPGRMPH